MKRKILFGCFDGLRGLEIGMTADQAFGASHSGQCDDDVIALCKVKSIKNQLDLIGAEKIRLGLKECGAWTAEELDDQDLNRQRAVWIAACDIRENYKNELTN